MTNLNESSSSSTATSAVRSSRRTSSILAAALLDAARRLRQARPDGVALPAHRRHPARRLAPREEPRARSDHRQGVGAALPPLGAPRVRRRRQGLCRRSALPVELKRSSTRSSPHGPRSSPAAPGEGRQARALADGVVFPAPPSSSAVSAFWSPPVICHEPAIYVSECLVRRAAPSPTRASKFAARVRALARASTRSLSSHPGTGCSKGLHRSHSLDAGAGRRARAPRR